jgi:hypothetical protein
MISKDQSISLLVQLFDNNKLTFREIALLRKVFDEAVAACNEERADIEADYNMGRGAPPTLPSQDIEDDFYYTLEAEAEQSLAKHGIRASGPALSAVVDFAVEKAEYEASDFYHSR